MAEYKDVEPIIKKAFTTLTLTDDLYGMGIKTGIETVVKFIKEQPSANVEEVRHGEWIEVAENSTGKIMVCTKCKNCINPNKEDVAMNRASERPSYCPNCGAKMDGGN